MQNADGSLMIDVEITEDDIWDGVRGSACCCPAAVAINRTLGLTGYDSVSVCTRSVLLSVCPSAGPSDPCDFLKRFVRDFDTGVDVEPCRFGFTVPGAWVRFCPALREAL